MSLAARLARSRRTPLILAALLGFGGLAWGTNLGYHALVDPAIRIENASGHELWDIDIQWHHWGDGPRGNGGRQWSTLRPGESRRLTLHDGCYPTAFTAVCDGRRVMENLTGFYVGSRETLVIRVLPGGRVVRGFPHTMDRLAP
jgi:hypothetical protein